MPDIRTRTAIQIVRRAGSLALDYFRNRSVLEISRKGHQDYVSEADRQVEETLRKALKVEFPDDAILGEELAATGGNSGFTWVIDPIDGTTNFLTGISIWAVVLAGVRDGDVEIGIIYDPCHDEMFVARKGAGATLNGAALELGSQTVLSEGTVGIGFSNRVGVEGIQFAIAELLEMGGVFARNGSGAVSLAWVAAGRLLGYIEEHMNAWDCLAGQLIVEESGGCIEEQSADVMLKSGGRVVVGAPGAFEDLRRISDLAFSLRDTS